MGKLIGDAVTGEEERFATCLGLHLDGDSLAAVGRGDSWGADE